MGRMFRNGADIRYIPIPQQGTPYIFSMESDEEFAKLVPKGGDDE